MIIFSELNYRSLDRRLCTLERKLADLVGSETPAGADREIISDDKLHALIAQLPPERRSNAEKILQVEREHVAAADINLQEIAAGNTSESDAVGAAQWAMYCKEVLGRYLSRGRTMSHVSDEDLRRYWITFFQAASITGQFSALEDVDAEFMLRGLEPPVEAVRQELRAASKNVAQHPAMRATMKQSFDRLIKRIDKDYD